MPSDEKHLQELLLLILFFLVIIGILLGTLGKPDVTTIGWGFFSSAAISFIIFLIAYLWSQLHQPREIKGVIKVIERSETPLYLYLKPELEKSTKIDLIGNVLHTDLISQPEFRKIIKDREKSENFLIRVCLYFTQCR